MRERADWMMGGKQWRSSKYAGTPHQYHNWFKNPTSRARSRKGAILQVPNEAEESMPAHRL
jgi:hypothetical protein